MRASIARFLAMSKNKSELRYVDPTKLVPPYQPGKGYRPFHKGDHGRVLVVGGCQDYSGAPAMAALSAARTGADMVHVLCPKEVSPVIKTYNPNIMVHGYLEEETSQALPKKAIDLLDRMHVVLIGCGLGREPTLLDQVKQLIQEAHKKGKPLVIDADGLFLVSQDHSLITTGDVTLTPNYIEFLRLCKSFDKFPVDPERDLLASVKHVTKTTGCKILLKNENDIVSSSGYVEQIGGIGSPRRTSGQGDILAGCVAAFTSWRVAYQKNLWDKESLHKDDADELENTALEELAAPCGAAEVVRLASSLAFDEKHRSMMANDVLDRVGEALELFLEMKRL